MYGLVAIVLGGNLASFPFNRQVWPVLAVPYVRGCEDPHNFETLALVGEPVDGGEISLSPTRIAASRPRLSALRAPG